MSRAVPRARRHTAAVLLAALIFIMGAEAQMLYPAQQLIADLHLRDLLVHLGAAPSPADFALDHDNVQEDPREIECPGMTEGRVMVALIVGQSNAANYGETRGTAPSGVFNFYRGKCYVARDPLLGADGYRGSVWTRMASRLKAEGVFDRIVLAPVAIASSTVDDWAPGGKLFPRIEAALSFLAERNLRVTHVLWHQGETDAARGLPGEIYRAQLAELISFLEARTQAKIFVSQATVCASAPSPEIRDAQEAVLNDARGVLRGVDTDQLGPAWRVDGCHLSDRGLARAGDLWAERLR
jgi:hypothetical protein